MQNGCKESLSKEPDSATWMNVGMACTQLEHEVQCLAKSHGSAKYFLLFANHIPTILKLHDSHKATPNETRWMNLFELCLHARK